MEDMTGGAAGYGIAIVGALLQAWVLAHFVAYAGSNTFLKGLVTGFWIWLGFMAVGIAVGAAFEGRKWDYFKVTAGNILVVMLINGGLLAAWH